MGEDSLGKQLKGEGEKEGGRKRKRKNREKFQVCRKMRLWSQN